MREVKILLVLSILLTGCATANFTPTSDILYDSKDPTCGIEVFSAGVPERDYEEIGIIEGQGKAWKAEMRDVLPVMMEEGCRSGGDAIIIHSTNTFAEGKEGIANNRTIATVIRWSN